MGCCAVEDPRYFCMRSIERLLRRGLVFVVLLAIPFAWQGYGPPSRSYTVAADPAPKLFAISPGDVAPLVAELDGAKSSIDVWMYTITHPDLIAPLVAAERRGVAVRFIFEDRPFGSASPREAIARLREAGVEVIPDSDPDRYVHAKTIIIDGNRIIVGTANWTKAAFTTNREVLVSLDDAKTAEALQELFEHDVTGDLQGAIAAPLVVSPQQSRVVFEGLIAEASREINIATEVFDDASLQQRLIDAHRRGVAVSVLLADPEHIAPNRETGALLQREGITVYFVKRPFPHAKYLTIDGGTSFVGSQNLTSQSLDVNREIGVVTRSPELVRVLTELFHHDVSGT